jgi:hypothetical protein
MTGPVVVSFVIWNRPHYLKRVLDGWSKVRGVEDAVLDFHVEPGCDEAAALCEAADFAERHVHVNPERLGHARNVQKSMNWAFHMTDYAIQACEDFLPSSDVLELHAWHRARYRDDPSVLALTSGRDVPAEGGLAAVWRCQLIGALSGFHEHKWDLLDARWKEGLDNWWWWVDSQWCQAGGWDVLFPALSRADAIAEDHQSCFVPDPPPQQYHEVQGRRERARGFSRYVEECS